MPLGTGYSGQIKRGTVPFSNTYLGEGLPPEYNIYNIKKIYLGYEMPNAASKRAANAHAASLDNYSPSDCYHLGLLNGVSSNNALCNGYYTGNAIQSNGSGSGSCCPFYEISNNYSNVRAIDQCAYWNPSSYGDIGADLKFQCQTIGITGKWGNNISKKFTPYDNGFPSVKCNSCTELNCSGTGVTSQWPTQSDGNCS
jgi:hypothetical protein